MLNRHQVLRIIAALKMNIQNHQARISAIVQYERQQSKPPAGSRIYSCSKRRKAIQITIKFTHLLLRKDHVNVLHHHQVHIYVLFNMNASNPTVRFTHIVAQNDCEHSKSPPGSHIYSCSKNTNILNQHRVHTQAVVQYNASISHLHQIQKLLLFKKSVNIPNHYQVHTSCCSKWV